MARAKKEAALTPEERLQAALVPDWEWPYKLPGNWCWTKIGSISSLHRGVSYKKTDAHTERRENSCLVMRGGNICEGSIDTEADNIYVDISLVAENQIVRKNDIIIVASTGSTKVIGRAGISKMDYLDVAFGAFLLLVRPSTKVNQRYIDYFFLSDNYRNRIKKLASGININNIRGEYITETLVPLAPLAEQQRIVDRIESLFAKLDEAKEKAQTVVDSFETRKAAILHKAFTGELTAKWREEHGVRMESWEKKSVDELCGSLKYGTAKKSNASGSVVVLRMGNLQQGEIDWSDLAYSNDPDDIEKYKLFPGDVLFNRTNSAALVGKTAIYRGEHPAIYAGYTQLDISTGYSVQIDYVPSFINLWGVDTEIKIITAWRVSVDPKCLNKLGKILNMHLQLSSKYGEYDALMRFLTETGMDFLEMIDLREIHFSNLLESVYKKTNTSCFKDVLQQLRDNYSTGSTRFGRYTVRYLLLNLREDLLERVMPSQFSPQWKCKDLYLSRKCFPFECNPLASDLADSKTSQISQAKYLARVVEKEKTEVAVPYWSIVKSMQDTGEIYCDLGGDLTEQAIQKYNDCLDDWEKRQGYEIISDGNAACIAAYEASTLFILNKLLELSQLPNKGQKEVNERYLRDCNIAFSDPKKEETLKYAFVNSRVLLIYGAAGTGKTTLIDMISTMLSGRRKLFLTKTHTALQNLQRRINNPGADASFVSINSFTKRVNLPDYDVIFVDECSTIDNRAMKVFLEKMRPDTFLVLAGDTYQIESIDFGNWFTYANDIIKTKGSNVELVSTWRTKDPGLIELWNETRNKGALITEKLVIDGPFSENIGEGVLNSEIMDEVILCLNYDGKFGLNNMNSYFQNANTEKAVVWRDWKYKVGDHILFNDTDRFSLLYNNLKGRIVQIELFDRRIRFTVDVEIPLTEQDCQNDGIEFIDIIDDVTRIRFDVLDFEEEMTDEDRKKTVVPFQLAYAVSIHKAQGLEYRSVKVVIPSSNAEKITHGIFYTAITRAKEKLKIYWSSETMQEVVAGFSVDTSRQKSLAIIKEKLKQDKNT